MLWLSVFIVGLVTYVLWDVWAHGPGLRLSVSSFALFFSRHRRLGKALGITYHRTDEWETTRDESRLSFPTFGLIKLIGIGYEFGNVEHIRGLKARQQQHSRAIDISQYIPTLVGQRLNILEIEDFLIRSWLNELTDIYNIPPPPDKEQYVRGIKAVRAFFSNRQASLGSALRVIWDRFSELRDLRCYLVSLSMPERVLMLLPPMTTIDNSLHNLVTDPLPIMQLRDIFRHAPVGFLPVLSKGRMCILDVVVNDADNPGNSCFGPKGMICPGNIVTSMVLKSVADLKRSFRVKVEGTPLLRQGSGRKIWNPTEVFVTFYDQSSPEAEELNNDAVVMKAKDA